MLPLSARYFITGRLETRQQATRIFRDGASRGFSAKAELLVHFNSPTV